MTHVWVRPLTAGEVMTKDVVPVAEETSRRTVAKLLLERGISAAPVVDSDGRVIGMISESDLLGREIERRVPRREWVARVAGRRRRFCPGVPGLSQATDRPVREVMASPVATVSQDTPIEAIAAILQRRWPDGRDREPLWSALFRRPPAGRVDGRGARALERARAPERVRPRGDSSSAGRHSLNTRLKCDVMLKPRQSRCRRRGRLLLKQLGIADDMPERRRKSCETE
jgi:CBS domain-containing protein